VGDRIIVQGSKVGQARRDGEIVEVIDTPGPRHYRVRWSDGHESIFFPSSDARVVVDKPQTKKAGTPAKKAAAPARKPKKAGPPPATQAAPAKKAGPAKKAAAAKGTAKKAGPPPATQAAPAKKAGPAKKAAAPPEKAGPARKAAAAKGTARKAWAFVQTPAMRQAESADHRDGPLRQRLPDGRWRRRHLRFLRHHRRLQRLPRRQPPHPAPRLRRRPGELNFTLAGLYREETVESRVSHRRPERSLGSESEPCPGDSPLGHGSTPVPGPCERGAPWASGPQSCSSAHRPAEASGHHNRQVAPRPEAPAVPAFADRTIPARPRRCPHLGGCLPPDRRSHLVDETA